MPVYLFHGAHDHTVSYAGAKAFLAGLQAPLKGFYTFPRSAHSPVFEEPARARDILRRDVLTGGTRLADGGKGGPDANGGGVTDASSDATEPSSF